MVAHTTLLEISCCGSYVVLSVIAALMLDKGMLDSGLELADKVFSSVYLMSLTCWPRVNMLFYLS